MIGRLQLIWNAALTCLIVLAMLCAPALTATPVSAAMDAASARSSTATVSRAAATAHQGLDGCGTGTGKALYDCVSRVLLQFCNDISRSGMPQVDTALRSAASGLRAAINKVQALSAISLAQAAISGALQQARLITVSNTPLAGWGFSSSLGAVASVLAHAAKLIQAKG